MNRLALGGAAALLAGAMATYYAFKKNLLPDEQPANATTSEKSPSADSKSEYEEYKKSLQEAEQLILDEANKLYLENKQQEAKDIIMKFKEATKHTNFQLQLLLLLNEQDRDKSLALAKELLQVSKTEAQTQLANVYHLLVQGQEQQKQGHQILEKLAEKFPNDPFILQERILWNWSQRGRTEKVRADCDKMFEIRARLSAKVVSDYLLARVYFVKSTTYDPRNKADFQEKLRLLNLCLEKCPRFVNALMDRYELNAAAGKYEEAMADITIAAEINRKDPVPVNKLAHFLFRRGKVPEAKAKFGSIITKLSKELQAKISQFGKDERIPQALQASYRYIISAGMSLARIHSLNDCDLGKVLRVLEITKSNAKYFNMHVADDRPDVLGVSQGMTKPEILNEPFDIWMLQVTYYYAHLEFEEGLMCAKGYLQQLETTKQQTPPTTMSKESRAKLDTWIHTMKRCIGYGENLLKFWETYPAVQKLYRDQENQKSPLSIKSMEEVLEHIQISLDKEVAKQELAPPVKEESKETGATSPSSPRQTKEAEVPEAITAEHPELEIMQMERETALQKKIRQQQRAQWEMLMDAVSHMIFWKTHNQTSMIKEVSMFRAVVSRPTFKIFFTLSHNGFLAMFFFSVFVKGGAGELQQMGRLLQAFQTHSKKSGRDLFKEVILYIKQKATDLPQEQEQQQQDIEEPNPV